MYLQSLTGAVLYGRSADAIAHDASSVPQLITRVAHDIVVSVNSVRLVADIETDIKGDRLAAVRDAATHVRPRVSPCLSQSLTMKYFTTFTGSTGMHDGLITCRLDAEVHCSQHAQEGRRKSGCRVQQAHLLQGVDFQEQ